MDFAGDSQSSAYLRRDVNAWSDSVKLRYGRGPDDNPFLWDFMAAYTRKTARMFDGIRVDNCHSTPLHVGQYLLDVARAVNPNLYVCAELFTGSETVDNMFTCRLGLSALIREAMAANSTQELSALLHRYGGRPIGSFDTPNASILPLRQVAPNSLFMDCTHDNETPAQKVLHLFTQLCPSVCTRTCALCLTPGRWF